MIRKLRNIIGISAILLASASPLQLSAQDPIEIEPLFEYPMAPEELTSIQDKSNYLVDHFWDPMDFKSKATVDQNALNHAFKIYAVPMRWAEKTRSLASADKLIEKISKNPVLLIQFTKAAEENIYSPRADVWIDEVYVRFLQAIVKNKKVPESKKKHYSRQLKVLGNSMLGEKVPEFKFTGKDGKEATYFPMTTPTMLIFGDPAMTEWRLARLSMETNIQLTQALERGKVNILYIVPDADNKTWKDDTSNYPSTWTVGCSPEVRDIFDFRVRPSIYVVNGEGKIVMKNVDPDTATAELLRLVSAADNK